MSQNKKPKKRKLRSDSVGETVKVAQAGLQDILLPRHVRMKKEDMPFWHAIIAEYAKSEWTNHQLEIAAMLARSMCDLENMQTLMRKEGAIIDVKNAKGEIINKKANPRKQFIELYTKNVLSLRRSLALHARGKMGEPRDIARRRENAKEIESLMEDNDDELFARPPKVIQ